MKSTLFFAAHAAAFPFAMQHLAARAPTATLDRRQAQSISQARSNCGVEPCLIFDATEQYVSTTGDHAYASPAADEIRGPCPGLNAAANHGYLSRSGVSTIQDTVLGLNQAYGMQADLSGFLAAYAILVDGDPVLGTWSIGGPPPSDLTTSSLLGQAQGISYSHNNYEGDASIGRFDAYTNGGDAHSLDVDRFKRAYAATSGTDRYSLDSFAQEYGRNAQRSIDENPYAFWAPFAGLVAPAAYNFVINFMSNHTAEEPSGYLDGYNFRTFFAIAGDTPDEFKWLPGQERIPDNWYRRTNSNQYSIAKVFGDLGAQFAAYPDTFYLGGNTGTTNSFVGVNVAQLTNQAMNAQSLMQGDNLQCFFAQFAQAAIPDLASLPLQQANAVTSLVNNFLKPATGGLDCPEVGQFDQTLFNKYPGHKYSPTGPATNY